MCETRVSSQIYFLPLSPLLRAEPKFFLCSDWLGILIQGSPTQGQTSEFDGLAKLEVSSVVLFPVSVIHPIPSALGQWIIDRLWTGRMINKLTMLLFFSARNNAIGLYLPTCVWYREGREQSWPWWCWWWWCWWCWWNTALQIPPEPEHWWMRESCKRTGQVEVLTPLFKKENKQNSNTFQV